MSTIPFDFEKHTVRVRTDEGGCGWFVGNDICTVLELAKPENALARLDADEKRQQVIDTPGGPQKMTTINESGLYSLIFSSRKAAAKRFKKWVTGDVLPTIRRTGQYGERVFLPPERTEQQVTMSVDEYSILQGRIIEGQSRIVEFLEREARRKDVETYREVARAYIEETALTDEEIAEKLESVLGQYLPEWVAWRRRCLADRCIEPACTTSEVR